MSENLTISQALRRIKKLQGQVAEQRQRASGSVTHLAEQEPAYKFSVSREHAALTTTELLKLQTAVAVANATTKIDVGASGIQPLAFAVRKLRELAGEIAWAKALTIKAQSKTVEVERGYDDDSGKFVNVTKQYVCDLPEAKRANLVADLQEQFDKLNDAVETIDHKTLISF